MTKVFLPPTVQSDLKPAFFWTKPRNLTAKKHTCRELLGSYFVTTPLLTTEHEMMVFCGKGKIETGRSKTVHGRTKLVMAQNVGPKM